MGAGQPITHCIPGVLNREERDVITSPLAVVGNPGASHSTPEPPKKIPPLNTVKQGIPGPLPAIVPPLRSSATSSHCRYHSKHHCCYPSEHHRNLWSQPLPLQAPPQPLVTATTTPSTTTATATPPSTSTP